MKVSTFEGAPSTFDGGLLALGRFADGEASAAERALDETLGGALSAAADRLHFTGKARQKVTVDTLGRLPSQRIILLGLGEGDSLSPIAARDYAALVMDEALGQRFDRVGIVTPEGASESLACGAVLGVYRFDDLKAEPEDAPRPKVESVELIGAEADATQRGVVLGQAVNLARTLVNEPPNVCTPTRLAELSEEIAKAPNFELCVLGWEGIRERKMGGIIGVSQGATVPPRFIHLSYTPPGAKAEDAICFVGKGLTFDSGGLSLKTAKGMAEMYIDMAGSAAVLGAMRAVADLQPDVPVHGIVGSCENMPGGNSYRPSDVLTMYSGKTVEVLNTDAEGRLVLADCIHYATQLEPAAIIDLATLTGACMVALGPNYAGLFSDDEDLAARLLAAATASGENLWRMPLDPKLARSLDSKRADTTNLGGQWGGAITAAQFLQGFKGECTWAHMDIAGPALADKDDASIRAGGTGYGVLTLWALLQQS